MNSFFVPWWAASPSEQIEGVEAVAQTTIYRAEPGPVLEPESQLVSMQEVKDGESPAISLQLRAGHQAIGEDIPDENDIDTMDLLKDIQLEDQLTEETHKDEGSESDEEGEGNVQSDERDTRKPPPSVIVAGKAYKKLKNIISPPWNKGKGYKDPNLDFLTCSHLEAMKWFLWTYINPESRFYDQWMAASLDRQPNKGPGL